MKPSVPSRRRHPVSVESLERRTLMSAWSTVSLDPNQLAADAMAADKTGNLYALDTQNGMIKKSSDAGATWTTTAQAPSGVYFNWSLSTDAAGDLFVPAMSNGRWQIFEQPAGKSGLNVVDDLPSGQSVGVAADNAGDVFAIGFANVATVNKQGKTIYTTYQMVRERPAGQAGFRTIYQTTAMTFDALTVIDGGTSAGVYVAAKTSSGWNVLKGSNGGQSWSLVDQFQYPTASGSTINDNPTAVVGDSSGNVFVAGYAVQSVISGYSRNHTPIYRSQYHWVVRKSGNGGGAWSTDDDYQLTPAVNAFAWAMGTDLAGHVYVVGDAYDAASIDHAIVRTNAGGAWATADDFTGPDGFGADYYAFTADSNGNLYAGGDYSSGWLIRSMPPAPTSLMTPSTSIFSTSSIGSPSHTNSTRLADELFAA